MLFPSSCFPSILSLLSAHFESSHSALLSLCQFNHFSHFKMTIPQFYRSSCLSLPVSTLTTTPTCPSFANVWLLTPPSNIHTMEPEAFPSPVHYLLHGVCFLLLNISHLISELKRLHPSLSSFTNWLGWESFMFGCSHWLSCKGVISLNAVPVCYVCMSSNK